MPYRQRTSQERHVKERRCGGPWLFWGVGIAKDFRLRQTSDYVTYLGNSRATVGTNRDVKKKCPTGSVRRKNDMSRKVVAENRGFFWGLGLLKTSDYARLQTMPPCRGVVGKKWVFC